MTCTITFDDSVRSYIDVATQAMIQWKNDGGVIKKEIILPNNNLVYSSVLPLSFMTLSHAGQYECEGIVALANGNEFVSNSTNISASDEVIIISMSTLFCSLLIHSYM